MRIAQSATPEPVIERVEVPILDEHLVRDLETALNAGRGELELQLAALQASIDKVEEQLARARGLSNGVVDGEPGRIGVEKESTPGSVVHAQPFVAAAARNTARSRGNPATGDSTRIKAGAERMVIVLARYDRTLNRDQLSTLAHVSKGGTLSEYCRSLIAAGHVDETTSGLTLTQAGREFATALGHTPTAGPMHVDEIVAMYAGDFKAGAKRMLDILIAEYPDGVSRNDLSERAGVSKGGTLSEYIRSLVKRGVAVEQAGLVYANPVLFLQ